MATLKPFRAIRPLTEFAARLAAPPYDVLNSAEARAMAAGNPYSFLHINKPEIDLPPELDAHDAQVYQQGADNLRRFLEEGVLRQDPEPCFYVYRQIMGRHQQTGLVALASVDDYEQGLVKKHELTRPEKEDDRVRHIEALNAQVGPVFLTFRSELEIDALLAQCVEAEPEYDFVADDGVQHVFWLLSDPAIIARFEDLFARLPCLYVADGHHRSAAAQRVRNARQAENPDHDGSEAYNYFLAVAFADHQLQIMAYNRVVSGLNGHSPESFLAALAEPFRVGEQSGPEPRPPQGPHQFSMYLQGRWYELSTRENYVGGSALSRFDVNILQEKVLAPLLGIKDPRRDERIAFIGGIRGLAALQQQVDEGEGSVAFACYPVSIEALMAVADAGEVMPPKSTWFEPKLRSGLAIHGLD